MKRLPASIDELRGLRAARWIRESTAGQVDRFGPDAQREHQDRAIERYGLVDTGLSWQVAHSGRTIATTMQWVEMLAGAGARWDVLVVGYVSRFARDLRTAVNARHDLHLAGGVILFADEQLLTSDEERWETWAREAVEAEAYSRRLGKRIREGYAAKRRRHADPGGHPPFGFRRVGGEHVLEPMAEAAHLVSTVFTLAAARRTDREVSVATGIPIFTVRGILTSPLYAGRLRDGSSAHWAPVVDVDLWQRVQAIRELRATRDGRPAKRRPYALSMLHCRACGKRLTGDTGRYRHNDVCPEFAAAVVAPKRRARGQHREAIGASYPADAYENAIRAVLGRVSLGAGLIAEALTGWEPGPGPDRLELARIERERRAAGDRLARDRDAAAFTATMARLDAAEAAAKERQAEPIDRAAAVEYLAQLPELWDDAPVGRRALAEALFERVEVIGLASVQIHPTSWALDRGLAEAFRTGSGGYGRGERGRAEPNRLIVRLLPGIETRIRIVLPPAPPLRVVRSA